MLLWNVVLLWLLFSARTIDSWVATTTRLATPHRQCQTKNAMTKTTTMTTTLVQQALQLSQQGQGNLTVAQEAAYLWETLLLGDNNNNNVDDNISVTKTATSSNSTTRLPPSIQRLAWPLYGHTLVRLGRDQDALEAWDQALLRQCHIDDDDYYYQNCALLLSAKAASCQRLLRYADALQLYQQASNQWGAFCCAMRLGNTLLAGEILFQNSTDQGNDNSGDDDEGLVQARELWTLLNDEYDDNQLGGVKSSPPMTPVARWYQSITQCRAAVNPPLSTLISLRDMIAFNIGPWDDYLLQYLDDKVHLHQLLLLSSSPNATTFWPEGYTWPNDRTQFQRQVSSPSPASRWMCKARAGYGSHGNVLRTAAQILNDDTQQQNQEPFLIQKIIEPPMLYQGRVFSLRIYVICFVNENDGATDYYVSRDGLVKLAAEMYRPREASGAFLWTNSGAQNTAVSEEQQVPLQTLAMHLSLDHVWDQLDAAIETVFDLYNCHIIAVQQQQQQPSPSRQWLGCFPKILGWDFLLDDTNHAWLLEINRFPGMEARNTQDDTVKQAVLTQAWQLAADRLSKRSHSSVK